MGTFGIALILLTNGFHHGLGFLFTNQRVTHVHTNPLGLNFHGSWIGAALIAVLAPVSSSTASNPVATSARKPRARVAGYRARCASP